MSSIDFHLARLTAQSAGCDPNRVQGDRPEFSKAFIAQCAGRVKPRRVYHALMAYHCADEVSMNALNLTMAEWCWNRIRTRHADRSFKAVQVASVAELAVLFYLNPMVEKARPMSSCAAWVFPRDANKQRREAEWQSKYSFQRDIIAYELANMKSDGDRQLRWIMRDEEVAL